MFKRTSSILVAIIAFSLGAVPGAFAAFGNLSLIRVISDLTPGSSVEVATDLGLVSNLVGKTNVIVGGGNDAFTNYTNPAHDLYVNYYVWQSGTGAKGTMYIASNNTTAPASDGSSNLKNSMNIINPYYASLPLVSGGVSTVLAINTDTNSFGGQFGTNALGTYAGYTQSISSNASLPLASLSTAPVSMTLWQFANNTSMFVPVTGVSVLNLTTNADGSTTINPASATKIDQTTPVTVAAPLSATYAQVGVTAIASGGNGTGAYSYSAGSSTACSVVATTGAITITSGTGICAITATRDGDSTYNVSSPSVPATVTINKATQTITFGAPPSLIYGGASGSVSAIATSQLPITIYGSSTPNVCTINGSIVTPVKAGTCTITADQAGNTNYVAAPQATQSFTVAKATPAINWATPAAITYGTPLSPTQLNASASVPGTLAYSPLAGTVLSNGNQNLSVTFTPTDSANYTNANTSVNLTVIPTVRIVGSINGYDTLLGLLPAITQDFTIQLRDIYATASPETLLFNNGFVVTLNGGMDANWAPTTGRTTIQGKLTIRSGKLIANRVAIK